MSRRFFALLAVAALVLAACAETQGGQNGTPAGSTPPEESPGSFASASASSVAASVSAAPSIAASPAASASAASSVQASAVAGAAAFDPNAVQFALEEVGSGFTNPLLVTNAGDGSGRVFVVEKAGRIKTLDGQTVLDITDRVNARGSEQGLLGVAFHPRFAQNGYLYVNYIDADGNTVIARFSAPNAQGDLASEKVILRQEQPASNHNGGNLIFGPDGYLYIGLGDGGGADDQFGTAQNLGTLLGKMLRIDVDGGDPYAIPADNPFVNDRAAKPEIFSYGLRNPWRYSFDRATGDLYIGDVGQNQYEWLIVRPAGQQGGENFGWPILEGTNCFRVPNCDRTGITVPVLDYPHTEGCTIIGGYVYRGRQYPAMQGGYIFGDYCSGRMWALTRDAGGTYAMQQILDTNAAISSFGEDEAGELYLSDFSSGTIYRVTGAAR